MKKLFMYFRNGLIVLFACVVLFLTGAGIVDRALFCSRLAKIDQCRADVWDNYYSNSDIHFERASKWNEYIAKKQASNLWSGFIFDWMVYDAWNDVDLIILPKLQKDK